MGYLDDLLLANIQETVQTLYSIQRILNLRKSSLDSSHRLEHLGLILDAAPSRIFMPQNKFLLLCDCSMVFAAVLYIQFHFRPLELNFLAAWDRILGLLNV